MLPLCSTNRTLILNKIISTGNKYLYELTRLGHTFLRVDLMTFDGVVHSIEYPNFVVGDQSTNYMLISTGTAIPLSGKIMKSLLVILSSVVIHNFGQVVERKRVIECIMITV